MESEIEPTPEQERNMLNVAEDLFGYSPCMHCMHFHGGEEYFEEPYVSCEAFPEGIPDEIFEGENMHEEAYPGDKGLRFEEDPRFSSENEK